MKIKSGVLIRMASVGAFLVVLSIHAQASTCDMSHYKSLPGLSASFADNTLIVTWDGEMNNELRLRLTINGGTPMIRDLSIRPKGSQWVTLASNLVPEFRVVTGFRRLPLEQIRPLMSAGVPLTPEVVEQNKWEAFWDAPLRIPGSAEGPGASSVFGWMPRAVGFNCVVNGKPKSTLFGLPLHFHSNMAKVRFLDDKFRPATYMQHRRITRVTSEEK